MRPHGWQPTRPPRPWESPGKNTGVGCHFLLQCIKVKSESEVTQSCLTLCDPMDCSLPGSSVHGVFQARVLEWGAIAFSGWMDRWLLSDNLDQFWSSLPSDHFIMFPNFQKRTSFCPLHPQNFLCIIGIVCECLPFSRDVKFTVVNSFYCSSLCLQFLAHRRWSLNI